MADFGMELQVQNTACTLLTLLSDSDWAPDRPTRKSVSSWVIMMEAFLLSAGGRTQSVIAQSSFEAENVAATAATSEAKYIQALFLSCGQHMNIHLRSDSTGAIGVANRGGCNASVIWTCDFCRLQAETAANRVRISSVPVSKNVADANTKPADKQTFARVLSIEYGRHRDPETVS